VSCSGSGEVDREAGLSMVLGKNEEWTRRIVDSGHSAYSDSFVI